MQILTIGSCLLLSLAAESPEEEFTAAREALLDRVHRERVTGVVFDCSAIRILDQTEFQRLRHLAQTTALLGPRALLAGLQPEVVSYLVAVDADVAGVEIVQGVDEAFGSLGVRWEESA